MGAPIRAALCAGVLCLGVGCGRLGFERGIDDAGLDAAPDAASDADASGSLDGGAGWDGGVMRDGGVDSAVTDSGAEPEPCPSGSLICEDFEGPTSPEWRVYGCASIPVVAGAGRASSAAFEVGPADGDCSISAMVPITPRGSELYVRLHARWGPRGGTSELLWFWAGTRQATVVWTETSTGPATVRTFLQGGAHGSDMGTAASRAGDWTCVAATIRYADDGYLAVSTLGGEITRASGSTRYADPGFDTVELGALNFGRRDSFAIDDIAIGTSPLPCD